MKKIHPSTIYPIDIFSIELEFYADRRGTYQSGIRLLALVHELEKKIFNDATLPATRRLDDTTQGEMWVGRIKLQVLPDHNHEATEIMNEFVNMICKTEPEISVHGKVTRTRIDLVAERIVEGT